MQKPVVKSGQIRTVVEIEPQTRKPITKRYRTFFTDAVGANGQVANEELLQVVVERIIELTKGEDIDGSILEPL